VALNDSLGVCIVSNRCDQIASLIEEAEREAYARGWRDAIAALQAKAPEVPTESIESNGKVMPEHTRGRPATKAIALVREIIIAKPGLKGVEVFRTLQAQGTPILERTMRSCLRRLRDSKVIWQRKGKWYPRPKTDFESANGEATTPPH